jgi:hypothetical protein
MLIVSLGGLGLILAAGEAFAGAGAAQGTTAHSASRPSIARSFGHHRGHRADTFWPGVEDGTYGPTYGEPGPDVTPPPPTGDVHYTYTYDVPWDAVHRFPPNVTPSARPYVPDCTSQTVKVPREDWEGQTADINVIRCY